MLTRNPKAATRRARSCHSSSVNDRPYSGAARRSSRTVRCAQARMTTYHGACSSEQLRRGRLAQLVRALP